MKNLQFRSLASAAATLAAVLALVPAASAADNSPGSASPNSSVPEPAGAPRPGRAPFHRPTGERPDLEAVGFLGVEVAPADPATRAQLSLPRDTGLVVLGVAPGSPAAGVLEEHDILLKLDDQVLIDVRQLAVLVRNHREGDEVALSYVRAGHRLTAQLKVGRQLVPKGGVPADRLPGHPGLMHGGSMGPMPGPGHRGGMGRVPEAPAAPMPPRD